MQNQVLKRQPYAQMGTLLEYPAYGFRENLLSTAKQIESFSSQASDYLKEFFSRMKRMELEMWQEYYVQTFDLMPQCTLYLSVHLFGEESFKRAELMAGLKETYDKNDSKAMTELPDHLAVVLKQNACFNDKEWAELVSMCVLPALSIMIKKLEKNNHPYVLLLKSIQCLLIQPEKVHV